jgi:hypothetical protein
VAESARDVLDRTTVADSLSDPLLADEVAVIARATTRR